MEQNDKVEFEIQVSAPDVTDDELDNMTRQLLSEVRELNVESAELAKGGTSPAGTKGDAITVGAIAIEVLPSVLPSVIAMVQSWVTRGRDRTVKFKGKGIEFEGSPEELYKLLEQLDKGKRKNG